MIAHYGYTDGSGDYFISIDTGRCIDCEERYCVSACPEKILEIFVNDYDEEVIGVVAECRQKIKYVCAPCKPVSGKRNPPCLKACPWGAITHSW
jgi:Fe-S-cluster-containing hydrogenase component 2